MKNYMILVALIGLFVSCGPSDKQEQKLVNLVAEWKTASEEIVSLSEKVGDQMYVFEANKEEGNNSEMISINIDGKESNCEAAYAAMKEQIDDYIEVWRENSLKVDELTNNMSMGNWSAEDDKNLKALDLEVKKSDVSVEKWNLELEELQSKCEIDMNTSSS
ncbi:hypothetical protein AAGF08_06265 [Algoriphagus sp. SE2]|uniref:hypothetical protein n=1 Tax=Algoriphagus sp. SE2 TaxID=3141536 RepID=UPI0031CD93BB